MAFRNLHIGKELLQLRPDLGPIGACAPTARVWVYHHECGHAASRVRYSADMLSISCQRRFSSQPSMAPMVSAILARLRGGPNCPSEVRRITASSKVSAISSVTACFT